MLAEIIFALCGFIYILSWIVLPVLIDIA